jgi:hypothetical protein
MGLDVAVHGRCRASFKTWAGETGQPYDISEAALNHTQGKSTKLISAAIC